MSCQPDRAQELWWRCLASAFRTATACTIVGCATLFGPACVTRHLAYPAFCYVTVILIVTDATLGDALRGCWLALYATVQSVGPAILSLWLIGPARLTTGTTALAVATSALVVALPERTHLVAKRIALGQIVIVYVIAFVKGSHAEPVMHPVQVAASTALGVLACVLALLFPYPNLACCEVKKNCKLFVDNASERLLLFVKAFSAEDNVSSLAWISQAKLSAVRGTKYLQIIKSKQESMQWERFPIKFLKPYCKNPGERLEELNIPLRGMEIALTNSPSIPAQVTQNQELRDGLLKLGNNIGHTLEKVSLSPLDFSTFPESPIAEDLTNSLQTPETIIPQNRKDLPYSFFLFCLKLLQKKTTDTSSSSTNDSSATEGTSNINSSKQKSSCFSFSNALNTISNKRLLPAFKCSLSLGLAVLFGLIYSKENGFWSGLPVAISLAGAREATFKVANIKAQGTVLGTVYGVLGCFVFERFIQIRFLSLLPWFIFTSFLRRSRMYGQAGGISAVIGAVLILGRRNFGPPSEFAIARIVETIIGLSCSILVETLLQPTRAATLAKAQLSRSLHVLHNCVSSISLTSASKLPSLEDSHKKLKAHVHELKRFIGEAEVEPNFWFLPFPSACYGKLLGSLSKMEGLLVFVASAIGFIEQESGRINGAVGKESVDKLEGHFGQFRKIISSPIKCLEEVTVIKSLPLLEKELEKNRISPDLELGKSPSSAHEDEIQKIIGSYLQHSRDVVDKFEGENELKTQLGLNLSALAFCMDCLVRETQEIEKGVKELIQWENPSSHINLRQISCKIHALFN